MRIDQFLWCVRQFKSRNLASSWCKKSNIKINNILVDNDLNDTPFILYKKYLDMFNNGEYEKLLKDILNTEEFLKTTQYGPKLGLIRTISLGRVYGLNEFKKKLNNLTKKYPNSEESKYAINSLTLFNEDKTDLFKKKVFKNYKWIFVFDKNQTNKIEMVKNKFLSPIAKPIG